jgi:putative transposase
MARLARAIFPGLPHHVTQRGNGRAQTFFGEADYRLYRDLLAEQATAARVQVWAWVLMPNHVHLVLVPSDPDGIRRTMAVVHRRYASHVHARLKRSGHFWQGRFGCVAMDELAGPPCPRHGCEPRGRLAPANHLGAAVRYVALNPVRARLCDRASDWPWSSVHVHLGRVSSDRLTTSGPVLERFPDFAALLASGEDENLSTRLRKAESIGRPLGDARFLTELEARTGRALRPARRGPKPRSPAAAAS